MAACNITIKATNGESSLLFKDLLKNSNSPSHAIDTYYYTKTDEFKKIFGEWESDGFDKTKLDPNGEPKYSEFSKEAYSFDTDYSKITLDERSATYKHIVEMQPTLVGKIDQALKRNKRGPKETWNQGAIKKLEDIKKLLEEEDVSTGVPVFIRMASKYTGKLLERAQASSKSMKDKEFSIRSLARLHKDAQAYSIIEEVQNMISTNDGILDIFDEGVFGDVSTVLGNMKAVEALYIGSSKKFLVSEFNQRDPSWSKSDIAKWLDESPRDVRTTELYLEYLGDSSDRVLARIGAIVKNTENEKRREAIKFNLGLVEVQENLEKESGTGNAEKMYSDIVVKDDEGSLALLDLDMDSTDKNYAQLIRVKSTKPALFEFLQFYTENYENMQEVIGKDMNGKLPSVLKSSRERMQGKTIKDKYNQMADEMKKAVSQSNQDLERGELNNTTGEPIKAIPVFYTHFFDSVDQRQLAVKLKEEYLAKGMTETDAEIMSQENATSQAMKNHSQNVTMDLAHSLQSFHAMAMNFGTKNAVIDIVESAKAVVGSTQRNYVVVDSGGKAILDRTKMVNGEFMPKTIPGIESNAFKQLSYFVDKQVYGQTEKYTGTFNLMGKEFDKAKLLRGMNSSTSWIQMSFNVLASLANVGNGEYNNWMESIGGEYYKTKNYRKASKEYRKGLQGILSDVGRRAPKSKLGLIIEEFDFIQDFQPKGTIKGTENTSAKRLLKTNLAFFMQSSGEHFMQARAGLAILDATAVFSKDGTSKGTLLDALSAKDGKLVTEANLYVKGKDGNLTKYNTAQQDRITNKIHSVIRKLHGNYSSQTASLMKQDARHALILKYRDWAYEGITRRYAKKQYYDSLENEVEGFYRTGARVGKQMAMDLAKLQFGVMKENWSALTPHEKANIRRAVTEVAMITALGVAGALLGAAGKGMKEELEGDDISSRMKLGAWNLLVYEVNRLQTEIAAYINPMEALRLMQSPAATSSIIESVMRLTGQLFNPLEQYEAGHRKGQYKMERRIEALTPIYKNFKTLTPEGIEEKGMFYEI